MLYSFFNSDLKNNVENIIDGSDISSKLDEMTLEVFIAKIRQAFTRKQEIDRDISHWLPKGILTFPVGIFLDLFKELRRIDQLNDINQRLCHNKTITKKEAMLELLTGEGMKDMNSYKFLLINFVFEVAAKSDEEAELVVEAVIGVLQSDKNFELACRPK